MAEAEGRRFAAAEQLTAFMQLANAVLKSLERIARHNNPNDDEKDLRLMLSAALGASERAAAAIKKPDSSWAADLESALYFAGVRFHLLDRSAGCLLDEIAQRRDPDADYWLELAGTSIRIVCDDFSDARVRLEAIAYPP